MAPDGGHRQTGRMSTEPADKEDGKGLATSEDNDRVLLKLKHKNILLRCKFAFTM